jgi:hypothetical protein
MAKKKRAQRQDPHANKSLAIRLMLEKMPAAKASDVAAAVLTNYGHRVTPTLIYLVKSKANIKSARRGPVSSPPVAAPSSAASWVESIKLARRLLQSTGSVENAIAILKAVEA